MEKAHGLVSTMMLAAALALPGVALAQAGGGAAGGGAGGSAATDTGASGGGGAGAGGGGGGGANMGANKETGTLPSQRLAVTRSAGQGAILTISSSGVREVQQALNRLGYSAGPITGSWNKRTQEAMREFQSAHGLEPTGNLDISSIDALGLWQRLIGNPTGNGHNSMVGGNATGAPAARGNEGGANGGGGNSSLSGK